MNTTVPCVFMRFLPVAASGIEKSPLAGRSHRKRRQRRRVCNGACRRTVDLDGAYAVSPVQVEIVGTVQQSDADRVVPPLKDEGTNGAGNHVGALQQMKR